MEERMRRHVPALAALLLLPIAAAACAKADETPAAAAPAEVAASTEAVTPEPPPPPPEPLRLDQLPGPAAGKWKIEATMDGRVIPATEICYTDATLAVMAQTPEGTTCSDQTVDRDSGLLKIHMVCNTSDGRTTTMDSTITGDLGTAYTNDMQMKFSPPVQPGVDSMHMIATATRLGDC